MLQAALPRLLLCLAVEVVKVAVNLLDIGPRHHLAALVTVLLLLLLLHPGVGVLVLAAELAVTPAPSKSYLFLS